mmetsp:Transcript_55831/g.122308  ORF Transcript_55831/g.122308 Transcript_55831/m.122308 type:complete len:212 (+) Transcript_55831:30-665(+)
MDSSGWALAGRRRAPATAGGLSHDESERREVDDDIPRTFSRNASSSPYYEGRDPGMVLASSRQVGMIASASTLAAAAALPGGHRRDRWVTVFGFPADAALSVRQYLESVCRTVIEEHHVGDGNFMHLCFRDATAARNALQLSPLQMGKLMIGVTACSQEQLLALLETSRDGGRREDYFDDYFAAQPPPPQKAGPFLSSLSVVTDLLFDADF